MYESFWELNVSPFANGGSKGIFAETPTHLEALARLQFLIEYQRRLGILSGPDGAGKSSVLQQLHRKYQSSQRQVAFVDLSRMDAHELLWHLNAALHLGPSDADPPLRLWRILEDFLNGLRCSQRQAVFLFDHFDPERIEVLRVVERLQHLECALAGWTTTILAVSPAQACPEMNALLELTDLRVELQVLDRNQTALYVQDLLRKAGAQREFFEDDALQAVYEHSNGLPREIDRICDFALLVAMQEQQTTIGAEMVLAIAEELQSQKSISPPEGTDHALVQTGGEAVC